MVRLSDLNDVEAEHMRMRAREMHPVAPAPWIKPKALKDCTVAIISTAGLHRRGDAPFKVGAIDYRLIPGDADFSDLVELTKDGLLNVHIFEYRLNNQIAVSQSGQLQRGGIAVHADIDFFLREASAISAALIILADSCQPAVKGLLLRLNDGHWKTGGREVH